MKKLLYYFYSFLFKIYRLFKVQENRISLVSPHNAYFTDSLKFVEDEFSKRGDYEFNRVSSNDLKSILGTLKFFIKSAYKIATSKFVFLNDNFMPFSNVRFSDKTKVIQLWHGQGVFKKFGLDSQLTDTERQLAKKCADKYDYIVVSSENVANIYMSAFNAEHKKIIVSGIPESDYYYLENKQNIFREKYNIPKEKKIVLYAPTFRDNAEDNKKIFENFLIDKFNNNFSNNFQLVVRLHPQVHEEMDFKNIIDATDYKNVNEIISDADILITDYSSICMEFAMLKKPMLFFAYDLDKYKNDRNFYFDYEEYVPGKVVKNFDELVAAIKNNEYDERRIKNFNDFNFSFDDGKSTQRLVDFLLKNK